jgi:hypothetical protein
VSSILVPITWDAVGYPGRGVGIADIGWGGMIRGLDYLGEHGYPPESSGADPSPRPIRVVRVRLWRARLRMVGRTGKLEP